MIIKCKDYFEQEIEELKKFCYLGEFHIIQINDEPSSSTYVRNKMKDFNEIKMNVVLHKYLLSETESARKFLESLIDSLNKKPEVIGIMIQLPIPTRFNYLLDRIAPEKDVDNLNRSIGRPIFNSCTPQGIMDYLSDNNIELAGKNVVIVGRSDIVGKPLAKMLTKKDATVTLCHSKTKDLSFHTKNADIVVCAIGKGKFFTKDYFSPNQLVIDVGINFIDGKMCGDVDEESADQVEGIKITSVPGGVGLLTRLALLKNCCYSCKRNYIAMPQGECK